MTNNPSKTKVNITKLIRGCHIPKIITSCDVNRAELEINEELIYLESLTDWQRDFLTDVVKEAFDRNFRK